MPAAPTLLVFDSGFGGLTVLAEILKLRPDVGALYVADDAGFPYGAWDEAALVERVLRLFETLGARVKPDLAVIACNTASTLVLGPLRARFPFPFVGTVPAIKPAAAASASGLVSVLATPGTVKRDYTRDLVARFAAHCEVTLIGAPNLAALAEAKLHGAATDLDAIRAETAAAFVEKPDGRRTDQLVLACTHFPLLAAEIAQVSPWNVTLVDPAPAIARRAISLLGASAGETSAGEAPAAGTTQGERRALFTGASASTEDRARALKPFGITRIEALTVEREPISARLR